MAVTLPTAKITSVIKDPKNLILFGPPKIGKTSILSCLDSCLILDFEDGSDYVDALKLKVKSINELVDICKAIKAANYPYDFIALDTVTSLVDFAKPLALKEYMDSASGKTFTGTDVLTAPHGAGKQTLPVFG